jgi:hypothetical protein
MYFFLQTQNVTWTYTCAIFQYGFSIMHSWKEPVNDVFINLVLTFFQNPELAKILQNLTKWIVQLPHLQNIV